MRYAVVGGRSRDTLRDRQLVEGILDATLTNGDTVVTGGARGIDMIAEDWARAKGVGVLVFEPKDHGDYLNRNRKIVDNCDKVLAFPGKESKGTWYTVTYAKKKKIPVVIYEDKVV